MARKKNRSQKIVRMESLKQLNLDAAGMDIHADEIWVCVPEDRDEQSVCQFGTCTCDLHALADWLAHCGVRTVAMEATGVYWVPIYEILEERGFKQCLVNPQSAKSIDGRKSDLLDCQWLQQLHTYGLLRASFRPEADITALRAYVRHRESLLRQRTVQIQHMQKALELMNVKLTEVVSDITGDTGMQIMRAIVSGERTPKKLASFRNFRCKRTEEEIAKALEGNYRPEHLFSLGQSLELFDFYNHQLMACDREIEKQYTVFEPQIDSQADPLLPGKSQARRRKKANYPDYDLRTTLYEMCGVDLTAIGGLDVLLIQTIIAEVGLDMSKWPSDKHFTSWLGLAPNNKVSAGKVKSRKTKPIKSRANQAFRLAAQSVARSHSALGAFYRRMRAKHGAPKAVTATARKIAVIFYHMLKTKEPFHEPGEDYYQERHKERAIRSLRRKAAKLGLSLVNPDEVAVT